MPSLDIHNCEIGTISSRQDHSCAFRVITPELRASEAGTLMGWHGKACRVTIHPHEGAPDEIVTVTTERDVKTPGMRLRNVLLVHFKQSEQPGDFETFYRLQMEKIIDGYKTKNLHP